MSNFKRRFCEISKIVALSSLGVGGRTHSNFRLGAVLVAKNGSIFSSVNSYKTDPKLKEYFKYPFSHAESSVIFKAGSCNCYRATLYISRIKRDGSLALARPCSECRDLIKAAGIKKVVFSTETSYELWMESRR